MIFMAYFVMQYVAWCAGAVFGLRRNSEEREEILPSVEKGNFNR